MGTKEKPSKNDCYAKALPNEPMFILLARDPDFARLIKKWIKRRKRDIDCGERPHSDIDMVIEAYNLAEEGETWRLNNMGKWRG